MVTVSCATFARNNFPERPTASVVSRASTQNALTATVQLHLRRSYPSLRLASSRYCCDVPPCRLFYLCCHCSCVALRPTHGLVRGRPALWTVRRSDRSTCLISLCDLSQVSRMHRMPWYSSRHLPSSSPAA